MNFSAYPSYTLNCDPAELAAREAAKAEGKKSRRRSKPILAYTRCPKCRRPVRTRLLKFHAATKCGDNLLRMRAQETPA